MGIEQLEPFIGEWTMEADFPGSGPSGAGGTCTFEWILGGQFLLERSEVPHPDAPDGFCIVGLGADGEGYTQHYFDSRGIARVYEMKFEKGLWELRRVTPDFTPLSFSQRYFGQFSDDGTRIDGRWESSNDGSTWELDFHLNYLRVA
jgi:hypothetical protein